MTGAGLHADARTGNCYVDLAVCIIEQRYFESDLSLRTVSERLHVSAQHLGRLFARYAGQSFRHYLLSLRMRHAASLLETSPDQIKSIAALVGYLDQGHFGQDLRRWMRATPSEYRAARGLNPFSKDTDPK